MRRPLKWKGKSKKRNANNLINWKKRQLSNATSTMEPANDNNTTENPIQEASTLVDAVSILTTTDEDMHDPLFDVKSETDSPSNFHEQSNAFDVKTETDSLSNFNEQSDTIDVKSESDSPSNFNHQSNAFDVKSDIESTSTIDEQSNEFIVKSEMASSPTFSEHSNFDENVIQDERFQCRLCLTEEENNWIDIFSSKPYPCSNVDDITPSNIVEVIEQSTTIKISKDDQLPDKLCLKCFQSLRFVYKFRETSLRSQDILTSEVHEQNEQEKILTYRFQWKNGKKVKVASVELQPIQRPEPHPKKGADNVDKDEWNCGGNQCEFCGRIFTGRKEFQYHLNRHHDLRPFACTEPYCDKSFNTPKDMRVHIRNMHSNDTKFNCDICEKTFKTMKKLTDHRTIHFPPTIPCTICGKLLRNQKSVSRHRICHVERLFRCDDCGKSFQNRYTLRVHRRIHTNEKPFICSKCGEAFAHNCSLKAHDEKMHPES